MAKLGGRNALSTTLRLVPVGLGLMVLASCAEVEVGAEAVKAINSNVSNTASGPDPQTPNVYQAAAGSRINPTLEPAPVAFEARGNTVWDGRRTLQGIWVAHPRAETAMRVRVINTRNGVAVDGALFRREVSISGSPVLVSSEAAEALRLEPNQATPLVITALRPKNKEEETIASSALDDVEGEETVALAETETQAAPADELEQRIAALPEPEPVQGTSPEPAVPEVDTAAAQEPLEQTSVAETTPVETQTEVDVQPEVAPQTVAAVAAATTPESTVSPTVSSTELETAPSESAAAQPTDPQPSPTQAALPQNAPSAAPASLPTPSAETVETQSQTPAVVEDQQTEPTPATVDRAARPAPATIPTPASDPVAAPIETATIDPDLGEDLPTSLFVRAGTFSVRENADRLVTRIRAAGYPAVGRNFTSEGRELTTVTAGPFSTRRDQERALKDIRAMGLTDAFASQ